MTLRAKTLLMTAALLLASLGIVYGISYLILMRGYDQLEEQQARGNVARALRAVEYEASHLSAVTADWAQWDDTYSFMADGNPAYVRSNMVDSTFQTLGVNLVMLADTQGEVVYSRAYDLVGDVEDAAPSEIESRLSSRDPFLFADEIGKEASGIILLPGGPMLVASEPILTSEDEGPCRGVLLMGRYVDAAKVSGLADTTQLSLTVQAIDGSGLAQECEGVLSSADDETILTLHLDSQTTAGYSTIGDIYGEPCLALRVDTPREIHAQGERSIRWFSLSVLAVGLVFGSSILIGLEKGCWAG